MPDADHVALSYAGEHNRGIRSHRIGSRVEELDRGNGVRVNDVIPQTLISVYMGAVVVLFGEVYVLVQIFSCR
jgi:hypothetical protein